MSSMRRSYVLLFEVPILVVFMACPVYSGVIFESASLGPTGQFAGTVISPFQFLGARFSLSQTVDVAQIGGHLGVIDNRSVGSFFGAILALSSSTALPVGNPFAPSEVVATTTFNLPFTTEDILRPLSVRLGPGNYALVFGAGEFGSPMTAVGVMPDNNIDFPGASYFFRDELSNWRDDLLINQRFVVAGTIVPEPISPLLFGSGLAMLVGWRGLLHVRTRNDAKVAKRNGAPAGQLRRGVALYVDNARCLECSGLSNS